MNGELKKYRIKLTHIDNSIIVYSNECDLSYGDIESFFSLNFSNFDPNYYTLTWADPDADWVLLKDEENLLNEVSTQLQEFQRVHFSTKCTRALSGLLSNLSVQTRSYTSTQDSLTSIYRHMLDLSRNLGHMKLQISKVHNVMIVTKPGDPTLLSLTSQLTNWILTNFSNIQIFINEKYINTEQMNDVSDKTRVKAWTDELINQVKFDLCITLGGDGTVLFACSLFQETVPPIVPFHLGSLGFLTVFNFKGFEKWLPNILNGGKVPVTTRMRFTCSYFESQLNLCNSISNDKAKEQSCTSCENFGKDGIPNPTETYQVLNELVVDRGSSAAMIQVELYANSEHWTTILADGLVISTTTGSTAYNLSANGSLAHPAQNSLLITPICPHTLTCRPMILPAWIHLRLCIPEGSRNAGWASFDGRHRIQLKAGNSIVITASAYPVLTLSKADLFTDWFNSIDTVLNWNKRILQKPLID